MGKPHQTPITFEERKLIQKYIAQGKSCGETARLIGRSKNGVVSEVRKGGGKDYNAKAAQKITDETRNNRYQALSERNKGNQVTFKMKQRIENLEMQVEILHDVIKGILNDRKD